MPENNKKSFLNWLVQGAQDARDAKVGAVGAGTVRQLYNEGKSEEAQEMAKNLAIQQGTALVNFIPAGFAANKGLPWVMTNMALPVLGGEVVNEGTRKVSNNKYNSFGDFVYNGIKLANVANGTFMETPLRFIADMSNPAYWAPYGKALSHTIEGLQSLTNAYNNLPVKIKFTPRENFRYRNIGGDNTGVLDLLESGIVRPPSAKPIQETKGINLTKDFTVPFFGHKGKMVDAKSYLGKWFVGAEDIGNFYKPYRNQWGYTSKEPLTINDVTINRRIFPKLTNSPYIEWAPGKYTEYNTPLKILQKNGFLTPNTPEQSFNKFIQKVAGYRNKNLQNVEYIDRLAPRYREWLEKNSTLNVANYTDDQLQDALTYRFEQLLNRSDRNILTMFVPDYAGGPQGVTFRNKTDIGGFNLEISPNKSYTQIGMIMKTDPELHIEAPYTIIGTDAMIDISKLTGHRGVISGRELLSPERTLRHITPNNYTYKIKVDKSGNELMGNYNWYEDLVTSLSQKERQLLEKEFNRNGKILYNGHNVYDLNNVPGYKYYSPIKILYDHPVRNFAHEIKSLYFDPISINYNNGLIKTTFNNNPFLKHGGKIWKKQ